MAVFEEIGGAVGGGGGGGGGRRKLNRKTFLIGGVFIVMLIVIFRRSNAAAPAQEDTMINPNVMDMPSYPNLDQQTLDNQFANYLAVVDQQQSQAFGALNDTMTAMSNHMDTNNAALLDAINNGLKQQITQPAPAAPVPVTPPKTTAAPNPLHPVSAGIRYATPRGGWNPNSVVDWLKSRGYKNSLNDRGVLAKQAGISGYRGTAAQNTLLLNKLKAL